MALQRKKAEDFFARWGSFEDGTKMNYTEVTIECKNTDETCDRLTALGVDGFVIENGGRFQGLP